MENDQNRQVCTDGSGRNVIPADSGYRGNYPHKSLFELLSDSLKEQGKKYDVIIPWFIMTSEENNDDTVVEQKKDTSVDDNSVVYKSYKIGDQVTLIDSSSWHVIKDTSTSEENVTLLKDDKIDTELKKDEIDNFLNTTYMKILKDNLSALSTDIKEVRLINTEDIKNITGLNTIELDTTIENVDWLYTEKTVIGSTSSNNLPLCIGKHDELEAGKLSEVTAEELLPLRPVITISKDYIRG